MALLFILGCKRLKSEVGRTRNIMEEGKVRHMAILGEGRTQRKIPNSLSLPIQPSNWGGKEKRTKKASAMGKEGGRGKGTEIGQESPLLWRNRWGANVN